MGDVHTPNGGSPPRSSEPALLLHSLIDLQEVWLPLLELADVHSVTEIGAEAGTTSHLLAEWLAPRGGRLVVVDPDPPELSPPPDLDLTVVRAPSPEALAGLAATDAYLIDGDHNYYTVFAELNALGQPRGSKPFPLVVLHDVGWPCARRDLYYEPERIPATARHPYNYDLGVLPDVAAAAPGGFRGNGAFAFALAEGGPRNGVTTAVEDYLSEHPDLSLKTVPSLFGLGVIVDSTAWWVEAAEQHLRPYVGNALLERLERNRLALYLKVLALQDELADVARARQRDWARMDAERSDWQVRELTLGAALAASDSAWTNMADSGQPPVSGEAHKRGE